jgi:uncharacterized protein (TIGR02996 family)
MTTEDDFQSALDADPTDWQTRLVFADWLEERGDPRGPGYRALALRRWRSYQPHRGGYWTVGNYRANTRDDVSDLPDDWFLHVWNATPRSSRTQAAMGRWIAVDTRREAEDAAARAFAKLATERQNELLAVPPPPRPTKRPRKK